MASSAPLLNSGASSVGGERLRLRNCSVGQLRGAGHDRLDAGQVEGREPAAGLGRREQRRRIGERGRRDGPDQALEAESVPVSQDTIGWKTGPQLAAGDHLGDGGRGARVAAARPPSPGRRRRPRCGRRAWRHRGRHRPGCRAGRGPTASSGRAEMPPEKESGSISGRGRWAAAPSRAGGAPRSAAPARSVCGRSTANSSPPMRKARSALRSAPSSSSPKPRRTRSPPAWPRPSLICLNSSRSISTSDERHLVAGRGLDLAVELLLEGAVVAEAGQRVAQRVGHRLLVAHLEVGLGRDQRGDRAARARAATAMAAAEATTMRIASARMRLRASAAMDGGEARAPRARRRRAGAASGRRSWRLTRVAPGRWNARRLLRVPPVLDPQCIADDGGRLQ